MTAQSLEEAAEREIADLSSARLREAQHQRVTAYSGGGIWSPNAAGWGVKRVSCDESLSKIEAMMAVEAAKRGKTMVKTKEAEAPAKIAPPAPAEKIAHPNIYAALIAAQAQMTNVLKEHTGQDGNRKFSYADLADGYDVVRPVFSRHGLAVLQLTSIHDGALVLETRLVHETGDNVSSFYPVCSVSAMADHRKMGGALTYARRFSLFAIAGTIGVGEDSENADVPRPEAPKQAAKAPVQAAPQKAEQPKVNTLPPYSVAESEDAADLMLDLLTECKTPNDLDRWVAENKPRMSRLLPADHGRLQKAYLNWKSKLASMILDASDDPREAVE